MWYTFILTGKINAVTFNKTPYIIDRTYILWYTYSVVQPIPGNGRRWSLYGESCYFFSCLLYGKHSRLLCLQMVRRRQVGQHYPSGYLSAINKQEEAPSIRTTEGFILFVYMDLLFLFAYWHYSICKMKVQYAKKVTDSQNGNVL